MMRPDWVTMFVKYCADHKWHIEAQNDGQADFEKDHQTDLSHSFSGCKISPWPNIAIKCDFYTVVTDIPTDRPTGGPTLLWKCEDASKKIEINCSYALWSLTVIVNNVQLWEQKPMFNMGLNSSVSCIYKMIRLVVDIKVVYFAVYKDMERNLKGKARCDDW